MYKVLALLAVASLSGCLAQYLDELDTPDPDRWYLVGNTLNLEGPGGERDLDWGWPEYMSGQRAPRFVSPAFDEPLLVVQANLTVTYRLTNVYTTQAPIGGIDRDPLTAWFGTDVGIVSHKFAPGPSAAVADTVTVNYTFDLPTGGLYVPPGLALRVDVASYYAGDVALVSEGSWLDVVYADSDLKIAINEQITTSSDVLVGGACVAPDIPGLEDFQWDIASVSHSIDVNPSHRYIAAFVVPTQDLRTDIDILVFGPDGQRIGHGAGSQGTEAVLYGPENIREIGSGTWTVVAYACSGQAVHANVGFGAVERF